MTAWIMASAFLWVVLTREPALPNIALGGLLGVMIARAMGRPWSVGVRVGRAWAAFDLLVYFLVQIFLANLKMAYYTIMPLSRISPGIVQVPLEPMSETALSLLANLITLTPGTLSVDVSPDRRTLFVHVMESGDTAAVVYEIKHGFEVRVLEVMS